MHLTLTHSLSHRPSHTRTQTCIQLWNKNALSLHISLHIYVNFCLTFWDYNVTSCKGSESWDWQRFVFSFASSSQKELRSIQVTKRCFDCVFEVVVIGSCLFTKCKWDMGRRERERKEEGRQGERQEKGERWRVTSKTSNPSCIISCIYVERYLSSCLLVRLFSVSKVCPTNGTYSEWSLCCSVKR